MKKLYNGLLFFITFLTLASCEDFMDIHKEFIEGGEVIYAPKPDSVSFIAGKGRILFRCWMYNSPNVKSIDIFWNDGKDSLIIPVKLNAGIDSLESVLTNMPEKSYTFDIKTTDNFGHSSLSTVDFGSSYGETYNSTLTNRRIKKIELSDKGGVVEWFSAAEGLVANEVRYLKNDGTQAVVSMPAGDYSVSCPDAKAGSSLEFRSSFIPENESIDTFYTAWTTHPDLFPSTYLYDRSNWSVLECSDETASDGGGMATLIDDDLGSYWHSNWEGENTPLPHWAIIDMESAKRICQLNVYRRPGNTDANTVQIFVSDSNDANDSSWVKIGEGVFTDGDSMQINVPSSVNTEKGRYLKIYLPDSNRDPFTSIAEIYVYGN